MSDVSVRDLRNYGGQILDRVKAGESMTITRDGTPVALLSPLPAPRLGASTLLERWKNVPVINAEQLRDDIAQLLDLDL
jgi:prevent-host-death family protein